MLMPNPAQFAVSRVAVHDVTASPVVTMVVDPVSSAISIQHPGAVQDQPQPDYIRDPESRPRHSLSSLSGSSKDPPRMLLKVKAREGLRLSFDLAGDILDSIQPQLQLQPDNEQLDQEPGNGATARNLIHHDREHGLDHEQDRRESPEQYVLPHTEVEHDDDEDDDDEDDNEDDNEDDQASTNTHTDTHTNIDSDIDDKDAKAIEPPFLEHMNSDENDRGTASITAADKQTVITSPDTGTGRRPGSWSDTRTDTSTSGASIAAPEDAPLTLIYAPTIYFAETRSEQAMHDLCGESAFQQQLAENPGSITSIKVVSTPDVDLPGKYKRTWEWNYHEEDDTEIRTQSHKAVFAFLSRNLSTGVLEVLAMFSLWIQLVPGSRGPIGVRFPSTLQPHSGWNAKHWRRTSTPEKGANAGRTPSFWNKFPAFPATHHSLPSLPEAAKRNSMDSEDPSAEPRSVIHAAPSIPLANDSEDGPLFRATVVECENHIRAMRAVTKRILKAAQAVVETRKAWVAAEDAFVRELDGLKPAEPLVDLYWRPLSQDLTERAEMLSQHMRELLIEPFSSFYGVDIKAAELHRRAFEEESKEYYSFLGRYMGMKQDNPQKKADADAKHDKKRRQFERKRFEYWTFLQDMRAGGNKGEELFAHLTSYTEKHCRYVTDLGAIAEELKPDVDTIVSSNKERQIPMRKTQSRFYGTGIRLDQSSVYTKSTPPSVLTQSVMSSTGSDVSQASSRMAHLDQRLPDPRQSTDSVFDRSTVHSESTAPSIVYSASNASTQSVSGFRDLEHQDIDAGLALGRRKEGFLFATSRPSPHNLAVLEKPNINWHKYWCVLSEGQLHEYSHWKKGVTQPHNEPINLRIATVRACRNQDRRFCFEVITPRFRRVYQATSSEDMNSWINVISNAIQSLLNGTSSCRNLSLQYKSRDSYRTIGTPDGKGLMAGLGGMARASMEQVLQSTALPASLQERVQYGQAVGRKRGGGAIDGLNELGQIIHPLAAQQKLSEGSQQDADQLGARLLQVMRNSHVANASCADCGAKYPDWCVINLGILVCIECSGIHRSLGTHISKVRSFNLDTTSYTKDLVEFIRSVGNNISNQVWEANLADSPQEPATQENDHEPARTVFKKPVVNDSREYKVAFIKKKYVEKAFVNRLTAPEATTALFKAVGSNDIPATIAAYVAGANLNTIQKVSAENDSGPFVERTDSSPQSPPLPERNDGTTVPGSASSTAETPALTDGPFAISRSEDSTVSETASQPSGTLANDPNLPEEQQQQLRHLQAGSLHIRPRPSGGRPISSVMVMQTSPLLIALSHGVPFSFDEQFEVYPLAEFLMQNGAASNASMEVKLLNGTGATVTKATKAQSGEGASTLALSSARQVSPNARPEETSQGLIERDAPLQPSSSIGSRLSAGTSTASTGGISSSGASVSSWESAEGAMGASDRSINRRSVGQIVELRGEEGVSAMEYLRAKGIARGDVLLTPSASSSSSPVPTTNNSTTFGGQSASQSDDVGSPRSSAQLDRRSISGATSSPSMSTGLISMLTLSPRARATTAITTNAAPGSPSDTLVTMSSASSTASPGMNYDARTNSPRSANTANQDISALFQKRRESDVGISSTLFSTMKAPSSGKDKEKAAAKAQARRSSDFSLLHPMASQTASSHGPQTASSHGPHATSNNSSSTSFAVSPPPTAKTFAEGASLSSTTNANSTLSSHSASSHGPSRTQKVKASLTKSIRMSAAYFKHNVIKDENKDQHQASPTMSPSPASPSKGEATPRASISTVDLSVDGGTEDEPSMAELLAQQDQQQQQPPLPHHKHGQWPLGHSFIASKRAPSASLFFSAMTFSSAPNLSQRQQQHQQQAYSSREVPPPV
ncbi:hypothetical protein BGZ75_008206 [Mortierella antarctica]|nr:hypothetical protein BGZ75_008206 [Mortierella antarctica]